MAPASITSDLPARPAVTGFSAPHLTRIADLSDQDLHAIFGLTHWYAQALASRVPVPPRLAGRTQINLFFENSTRTNSSFELAGRKLGADVLVLPVAASSVHKGEEMRDTVQTLAAMGADAMIVRDRQEGTSQFIADALPDVGLSSCVVLNAGEGRDSHPTQGLLDAYTMMARLDRVDGRARPLDGITVAIVGDIRHSRVAGSNAALLPRLGATVRFVGPEALLPSADQFSEIERATTLSQGLTGAHFVMALRMQFERMEETVSLDRDSYFEAYGVTHEALAQADTDAMVLHPGPMNRGIEIAGDLADDPEKSLILTQVRNGVAARMALLDLFLTERDPC